MTSGGASRGALHASDLVLCAVRLNFIHEFVFSVQSFEVERLKCKMNKTEKQKTI